MCKPHTLSAVTAAKGESTKYLVEGSEYLCSHIFYIIYFHLIDITLWKSVFTLTLMRFFWGVKKPNYIDHSNYVSNKSGENIQEGEHSIFIGTAYCL